MANRIITGTADENGRASFTPHRGRVGRFAQSLQTGDLVRLEFADREVQARVTRVHTRIQTCGQGSGGANFVAVDLEIDD
jgi:hypothetical protein